MWGFQGTWLCTGPNDVRETYHAYMTEPFILKSHAVLGTRDVFEASEHWVLCAKEQTLYMLVLERPRAYT